MTTNEANAAFEERLALLASRVDEWIRPYLEPSSPLVAPFYDMLAYHLGWANPDGSRPDKPAPAGKRLRPLLTMLTTEALGAPLDQARGPAVALELIHNFSLVHDDIQDDSDHRHGRLTVWKLWGIAQAINVGDAMFALAQFALADRLRGHPRVGDAVVRLNRTCAALVEGQYLDLRLESVARVDLPTYLAMVARKTAAMFECAAALGAIVANADSSVEAGCAEIGRELGMAFQFQDDVLGVWGDPRVTGKPAGDDIRSRKKSLPVVLGLSSATGHARSRLDALLSGTDPLDDRQVDEARTILDELAARQQAEALVDARLDAARAAIDRSLGIRAGRALLAFCDLLRDRSR